VSHPEDRPPANASEDPRLSLALALAHEAGRLAMGGQKGTAVGWKGPGDRVTEMDLRIQSQILAAIARDFPGDGILAEEGALGIPCFAISVAIFRCGEPYAGVVHDPNTGFRGSGLRGHGAFAGEQRLALVPRALDVASNVSVRVPVEADLEPLVSQWLREYKFRGFGSVALHLAFAALEAIDLVLDHKAALWDLAAGATIVLEAGGYISAPAGRPLFPFDVRGYGGAAVPFLAGNPLAHATGVESCRALVSRVGAREW
jgi:myo-inositol-1(or 4)-monophosphatase